MQEKPDLRILKVADFSHKRLHIIDHLPQLGVNMLSRANGNV